jgi:tetratricopeptide (TPR) repeat protein/regulation of enolase protein 1 (concanavalin A-like superfamily)
MLEKRGMERDDWRLETLIGLGEVYSGIGKSAATIETFEKAIALAKEMKTPPRQLVRLYHWIGETLWWQGRYDEAIRYGEMGLEILGDDKECLEAALMNSLIAVGNDNSEGDEEKWREYNRKNMTFIRKLEYSPELGSPYKNIVLVAAHQDNDLETALDWAEELEKRAKKYNDQRGLSSAWMLQGHILVCKGDLKSGIPVYQKALEACKRIGDAREEIRCYAGTATILLNSGNIEEAETYAQDFLKMAEQGGNPTGAAWAHLRVGDIAMSQQHWNEAISHYQKCLRGWQSVGISTARAYIWLGRSYLKNGDYRQGLRCFQRAFKEQSMFADALGGMEETYMLLDMPERFMQFCRSFKERYADATREFPLRQWYLEPPEPAASFSRLSFADEFEKEEMDSSWVWIDEFGDCACKISEANGLEIHAANRRDLLELNLSAPRFMREISGDFAVEACISATTDEKPQIGGLLVWKDRDNFLRFDKGVYGQHEIRLHVCKDGQQQKIGRGFLMREEIHLRLERIDNLFSAYCSADGQNWLTCGKLTMPMDNPVQIGIHAIGTIERTIHCGSFKDGTATLFRRFRVWTR